VDIINPAVDDYLLTHCTPPDDLLRQLAAETREAFPGAAGMQVSHDEGQLLTMLTRLAGARRAVEVGVFTGYSSICIARGMPVGGHLLACDVSQEWTSIARRYWKRADLEERIDLRIAPALTTLRALPAEPVLDLAFIDADKASYPTLLRGAGQPPAPRWPPHPRQCAAGRPGTGPGLPGRGRRGHAPDERDHRRRRPRGVSDAARTRWRHPRPQTLTLVTRPHRPPAGQHACPGL
jgi:O-methyltransferase